ncbi:hypothetical protein Taro_051040 [Colocasia esculenta]|uniref:Uncharacterized protein n=1 Tax=Colocasia esculenta TaxID=4460 RepID=A0A843XFS0_COLES|nr:hypothetical protein [Colocasia esculenta]
MASTAFIGIVRKEGCPDQYRRCQRHRGGHGLALRLRRRQGCCHRHLGRVGCIVCEDLWANEATAAFIRCDISVEEDVWGAVDMTAPEHGRLHVMFFNADILVDPAKSSIANYGAADFDLEPEQTLRAPQHLLNPFNEQKLKCQIK